MISLEIIAGEAFVKRVVNGKAATYPPQEAERAILAEINAKLAERGAARHEARAAERAYRTALLADEGCFAQRAAVVDYDRTLARLDAEIAALDKERADVLRLVVQHRAALIQKTAQQAIVAALVPFDLRSYT